MQEKTTEQLAAEAIRTIAALQRYDVERSKGKVFRWLRRVADKSLALSMAMFITFAIFTAVLYQAQAIQAFGVPVLATGIGAALLGIVVPLLIIIPDLCFMMLVMWKPSPVYGAEYDHDIQQACELLRFPLKVLELADQWTEQKMKRMERRMVRFLGGGDKVALLVVVGLGWATWKELGNAKLMDTVFGTTFNAGQSVLAFAAGIILAGLLTSRMHERLAFQRDIIALARARHGELAALGAEVR